jgi:hypothetical protein
MKLSEFLQQQDGAFSATRLAFLIWTMGALIVWGAACFAGKPNPIDGNTITLIGILATAKVAQKPFEKE